MSSSSQIKHLGNMIGPSCRRCVVVGDALTSSVLRPSTQTRCIASSSRLLASSKKKKVVHNPDAMPLAQAAEILRSSQISRPWSAYELEVVTRVDKSAPPLRGRVSLPRDARKTEEVVCVFAEGDAAAEARRAGAKFVGGEEMIEKILSGEIDPSKVISTPELLPVIQPKLARYLGQKGLMPTAKRGTVRKDVGEGVREAKGLMDWKGDKQGHVRAAVARITFPVEDVEANVRELIKAIKQGQAAGAAADTTTKKKGSAILRVNLGATQGPSIELKDVL